MGFFIRSKKVKKDTVKPPTKESRWSSRDRQSPPSPPPQSSPSPPSSTQVSQVQGQQQVAHHGTPDPAPFRPAGLLLPPPGWDVSPSSSGWEVSSASTGWDASPASSGSFQNRGGCQPQPIIVNQNHFYLGAPPPPPPYEMCEQPRMSTKALATVSMSKLNLGSVVDLAKELCPGAAMQQLLDDELAQWRRGCSNQLVTQSTALVDQISHRLDDVLTMIDRDRFSGNECEIFSWQPTGQPAAPPVPPVPSSPSTPQLSSPRSMGGLSTISDKSASRSSRKPPSPSSRKRTDSKTQTAAVAASVVSQSVFAKVDMYANSRLPMTLPPLKLYIPTYPLLCLAAQFSERVYEKPTGAERDAHVDADWRLGTKAMVIKSVPMDYMNTIVFAIRGTATFMDWAVNLNMEPTSPTGFLDDQRNLCHAGFLSVARKMVQPVARRLRQLLEEDPSRASHSLLITGHSAGGAVASLLYSHMLATSREAESELNIVAGCFKRVHCITFGTPPVSVRPLTKPDDYARRPQLRKSLFLTFVNEGDPVARADGAYVKSLLELFASPAPRSTSDRGASDRGSSRKPAKSSSYGRSATPSLGNGSGSSGGGAKGSSVGSSFTSGPLWKVPRCALSCAGRVVVLRGGDPRRKGKRTVEERLNEGVVAQIASDELLRGVIWGDPVSHMMKLYAGRIEILAVGAVTGRGY